MATRRELIEAVGERYRGSGRDEKHQILDEFLKVTGYNRKHAIRVLRREGHPPLARPGPRPRPRYNDEVRAAYLSSSPELMREAMRQLERRREDRP